MLKTPRTPSNLTDACAYFADKDNALRFLAELRWPQGVSCPVCAANDPSFLATRRIWKCRKCRKQFSVKLGTIFEDSPLGLDKWLPALWMLANSKNGISSYEVARALGVTQKTAWFMLGRIRAAMRSESFERMEGDVEADETYIGGKAKFMHPKKRKRMITGRGAVDKVAVLGILERPRGPKGFSRVRTTIAKSLRKSAIQEEVIASVRYGSNLYTDAFGSYGGLYRRYVHEVIDHAHSYVRGKVHTNGLENFWSLLKRTIRGTYVSVDPFHVIRYLDEQVFRFNNRIASDGDRFVKLVESVLGKRLTYRGLTGNDVVAQSA